MDDRGLPLKLIELGTHGDQLHVGMAGRHARYSGHRAIETGYREGRVLSRRHWTARQGGAGANSARDSPHEAPATAHATAPDTSALTSTTTQRSAGVPGNPSTLLSASSRDTRATARTPSIRQVFGPTLFDAIPKSVFGRVAYQLVSNSGPNGSDVGDLVAKRRLLELWDRLAPEGLPLPTPEERAALMPEAPTA